MSAYEPHQDPLRWRAVVADPDTTTRRQVVDALSSAGLRVVAEALTVREAIDVTRYFEPEVLVLDAVGFGLDAIAAVRRVTEASPRQLVILLTEHDDDRLGTLGLRVGAAGYLLKDVEGGTLGRAIAGVCQGQAVIPRAVEMRLITSVREAKGLGAVHGLTSRQRQVLELLGEGRTTREIAAALDLSTETVRTHLKRIYRQLGVHSRAEAAAAMRRIER
jgi:DNA-binding NarL/FixJ family response regulator